MKRIIVFAIMAVLICQNASAQILQDVTGFGFSWNRTQSKFTMGIPSDTATLTTQEKAYPHFAIKNGVPYAYNVAAGHWTVIGGGGASTLQQAYNNAPATYPQIIAGSGGNTGGLYLDSIYGGYTINDASGNIGAFAATPASVYLYAENTGGNTEIAITPEQLKINSPTGAKIQLINDATQPRNVIQSGDPVAGTGYQEGRIAYATGSDAVFELNSGENNLWKAITDAQYEWWTFPSSIYERKMQLSSDGKLKLGGVASVGINDSTFTDEGSMHIKGDVTLSKGAGASKVFTSDAAGRATWQDLPSNNDTDNLDTIINRGRYSNSGQLRFGGTNDANPGLTLGGFGVTAVAGTNIVTNLLGGRIQLFNGTNGDANLYGHTQSGATWRDTLPRSSGILAVSVNGTKADNTGNVTLPLTAGTVTSVGSGFGLAGGPVTTSGSLRVDSLVMQTVYSNIGFANVIDYGAVGDGVTNNNAAFAAAIATNKIVYVPKGRFLITDNTVLNTNQGMFGDGNLSMIILTNNGYNIWISQGGWVDNIRFVGDGKSSGKIYQVALFVYGQSNVNITRCSFDSIGGYGIYLYATLAGGTGRAGVNVSNCFAYNTNVAYNIGDGSGEYNSFVNCVATYCNYGFRISNGNNQITSCKAVDGYIGFEALAGGNAGHCTITGSKFNHNSGYNLHVVGDQSGLCFTGCDFQVGALGFDSTNNIVFTGGTFYAENIYLNKSTNIFFNSTIKRYNSVFTNTSPYSYYEYGVSNIYDGTFTPFTPFASDTTAWHLTGNTKDTASFIGTNNYNGFQIKTNSLKRMYFSPQFGDPYGCFTQLSGTLNLFGSSGNPNQLTLGINGTEDALFSSTNAFNGSSYYNDITTKYKPATFYRKALNLSGINNSYINRYGGNFNIGDSVVSTEKLNVLGNTYHSGIAKEGATDTLGTKAYSRSLVSAITNYLSKTGNYVYLNNATDSFAVGKTTATKPLDVAGDVLFTPSNTTGTVTNSGVSIVSPNTTSGTAFFVRAAGLADGKIVDISSNSTAATGTTQVGLNVTLNNSNATGGVTTTGASIQNSRGGSGINIGLVAKATGGATNYGLLVTGLAGFGGNTTPVQSVDVTGNTRRSGFDITPATRSVPTTGGTVAAATTQWNIIDPAGTLATLTITLPSSPVDGQIVEYSFSQAVTALTFAGGTLANNITTATAGSFLRLGYNTATGLYFIR